MDMDSAAAFLSGSILYGIGIVFAIACIVAVNNIISRYWKPVRIFTADSWHFNPPIRYATDEELSKIAPTLDDRTSTDTSKKH